MWSSLPRVARLLVVACLLSALAPVRERVTVDTVGDAAGDGASAAVEVRLRKLHLVRPDLIPYPIAYEVCC
jgi:hypothetical protein